MSDCRARAALSVPNTDAYGSKFLGDFRIKSPTLGKDPPDRLSTLEVDGKPLLKYFPDVASGDGHRRRRRFPIGSVRLAQARSATRRFFIYDVADSVCIPNDDRGDLAL